MYTETIEWIKGNAPEKCGWYLAAVRMDNSENNYYTYILWYNPESIEKWFHYTLIVTGQSVVFNAKDKIAYYAARPKGPKG